MATYSEILAWLRARGVRGVTSCHIAHVKEHHGLNRGLAPNRRTSDSRIKPCPSSKWEEIEAALHHFGMIQ